MSPLPPFLPQLLLLSMVSFSMGYPFGQLGSAVPAVSFRSLLATLHLTCCGGNIRKRKSLDALQALLSGS